MQYSYYGAVKYSCDPSCVLQWHFHLLSFQSEKFSEHTGDHHVKAKGSHCPTWPGTMLHPFGAFGDHSGAKPPHSLHTDKYCVQANTDGVESTFLFKQDGTLLAHASAPQTNREPRVMSAIASNIWAIYDKSGRASLNEDSLEMLMLDCEEGRLVLVPVNMVLLAVLGSRSVGPGMLR